jgi:hypothetical protein
MSVLRFPTYSKYRLAPSIAAALLFIGVVVIAAIPLSPTSAEKVAVGAPPPAAANPTPTGFALPPALLESREPEYQPPTF